MRRTRFWGAALAALACGTWALSGLPRQPRGHPLRVACWYWHRPFHLTDGEERALRKARIERLYVYAGTLVARSGALRLTRVQQWHSPAPCELYAVIRVHPQAHDTLLSPNGPALAVALLKSGGLPRTVRGIQWDADIPTARLPEYTRFLGAVRRSLEPGVALSVTALPDWLRAGAGRRRRADGWRAICEAVDDVAPQFYGNERPTPGRPPVLWETRDLWTAVRRSVRGRARVWVGLPAYGRCVVTDARGRPVGVRHDLDPDQLLEDPAWEVVAGDTRCEQRFRAGAERTPVENTLTLRCREDTLAGPLAAPAGTCLWFQWPRIDGLNAAVRGLRALSLPGVEGICLFRWPATGEPLALPAASLAAIPLEEWPPRSDSGLEVRLTRTGRTVHVAVLNTGFDAPLLGSAIVLEVASPRGAEVLADAPVTWRRDHEPASAPSRDRAVLTHAFLLPGRRWEACQVWNALGPVQATVRSKSADGQWHAQRAREADAVPTRSASLRANR